MYFMGQGLTELHVGRDTCWTSSVRVPTAAESMAPHIFVSWCLHV
jgi:hypothetical protein